MGIKIPFLNNFAATENQSIMSIMKLMSTLFITVLILTGSGCKESEVNKNSQGQSAMEQDPLVIPTPPGYYEPKDLKKLNLLEMYNLGTTGKMTKDFPLKDEQGNEVSWSMMDDASNQLFMQIYVDKNGKPAEGVVYKITDEIKTMIMKVRIVASPTPTINQ